MTFRRETPEVGDKLYYIIVGITLILIIPTWFNEAFDRHTRWLITLLSKDFRLLIYCCFLTLVLRPKLDRISIPFLLIMLLNIPSTISDIYYDDLYDNFFFFPKLVLTIYIGYRLLKK